MRRYLPAAALLALGLSACSTKAPTVPMDASSFVPCAPGYVKGPTVDPSGNPAVTCVKA